CMSPEKLVIDAEAIGMAKRMLKGMQVHTTPLAADMYDDINFKGEFLKKRLTRQLIKEEQYLPSAVIDRGSIRTWQQLGSTDTFERAKTKLTELLKTYQPPDLPADQVSELKAMVTSLASAAGMEKLPPLDE
ncbi:MAG: trimethylamine methyltransferase family protein, partial [Anaerolineales bacterium]|nr:trimethylamine methyltransferase family protein [Anaerolineales bacterium]